MQTKIVRWKRLVIYIALVAAISILPAFGGRLPANAASSQRLAAHALRATCLGNGHATIDVHRETGRINFVGTEADKPIRLPVALPAEGTPEAVARAYLSVCGSLFGLRDQASELTVMTSETDERGRSFVRFQQVYQGVPILGGEIIVQANAKQHIVSVNGEVLPDIKINTTPTVDAATARQRALTKVAKDYELSIDALTTSEPELWIYNPAILGGPGPRLDRLVWRLEVTPVELLPIRELVLVDAHTGGVALHFNQIDAARNRSVYDNNNVRSNVLQNPANLRRTEGSAASGILDVDRAYDYTGDTYDFYWSRHRRDSVDNAGMALISTTRYCSTLSRDPCPYPNAFWNGQQMVYGQGFVADDVVAHEMTHGVTGYTSRLFYYYQSGAINEAFSDIWGEFVDLTNGKGNDSPGVRWLIGEDVPGGAARSMSNPPAYRDPDRMTSSFYDCDVEERDNGGVHTNSGVGNKAAFLMVDGGTFNGRTVTGLGIPKVASIFYEVQTRLLTSASDYQDLYNALQQACTNLIGTNGITAADCQQVKNAIDAVEMNQQPRGCAAPEAPVCDAGMPNHLFFDDLENPSSGRWATGALVGSNGWYYPQNSHSYRFDATYATSGQYNMWGYDQGTRSDSFIRMTSDITLPGGAYMHFRHAHGFEDSSTGAVMYDGGVVEYSVDGGASWSDASPLFINNGYNGTLSSSSDNPLGGRRAFGGESNGYISSRLDLRSLAGRNVRFRFRIGTDRDTDDLGWFIDDIRIYTCSTSAPTPPPAPSPTPPPVPSPTPTPAPVARNAYLPLVVKPSGWQSLVFTTFENDFPGPWQVYDDDGDDYGEYFWARRSCRAFEGGFSGWAVGGGANGSDLGCGANYPNNANSSMDFGPFNLANASAAELRFKLWMNTESNYDRACALASINAENWYGTCWSGNSNGWVDRRFDLSNVYRLGNLMGHSQVWVELWFVSDESITRAEGVYVDNVELRWCPAGISCPATSSIEPASEELIEFPMEVTRLRR